jgi:methyl-accepting chemotaxis protein
MRASIQELTLTLGTRQRESEGAFQEAIHRMEAQVGKLTDGLREAAADAGGGLRSAVSGAGGDLRAAAKEAGAEIQSTATRMKTEMQDATASMGEATAAMIFDMQKSIEVFTSGVKQLAKVAGEAERSANTTRAAMQELQGTVQSLQDIHKAMGRTVLPLEAVAKSVSGVAASQAQLVEQMKALEARLQGASGALESAGEGLGEAWNRVHKRFEDIDGALARSFTEINRGVEAHADGVRKFVVELDTNLSRATQLLSGAIQELQEAVEDLGTKR